jgi:hypothetical protein
LITGERLVGIGRFFGAFLVDWGTASLLVTGWLNSTGFEVVTISRERHCSA